MKKCILLIIFCVLPGLSACGNNEGSINKTESENGIHSTGKMDNNSNNVIADVNSEESADIKEYEKLLEQYSLNEKLELPEDNAEIINALNQDYDIAEEVKNGELEDGIVQIDDMVFYLDGRYSMLDTLKIITDSTEKNRYSFELYKQNNEDYVILIWNDVTPGQTATMRVYKDGYLYFCIVAFNDKPSIPNSSVANYKVYSIYGGVADIKKAGGYTEAAYPRCKDFYESNSAIMKELLSRYDIYGLDEGFWAADNYKKPGMGYATEVHANKYSAEYFIKCMAKKTIDIEGQEHCALFYYDLTENYPLTPNTVPNVTLTLQVTFKKLDD